MRNLNKVQLLGNVSSEPEVQTTASGKRVAKFGLATNYGTGDKKRTQFHRVTCWEKTAEVVEQFVHKGDPLLLEGSIEYSTTEADGVTKYWTDIIAREVVLLKPRTSDSPFDE
jgi:single-strand DNA-binding protein